MITRTLIDKVCNNAKKVEHDGKKFNLRNRLVETYHQHPCEIGVVAHMQLNSALRELTDLRPRS